MWLVAFLSGWWEEDDPSQDSEGSPVSAAVVELVVVGVESTS